MKTRILTLLTFLAFGCDAPDPELDRDEAGETEGASETEEPLDDEPEDESGEESSGGELDPIDPQDADALHWPRRPTHPGPCDPPPRLPLAGTRP